MNDVTDSILLPTYPWQTDVWQAVQARLAGQRLGHGLLLSGVQGLGKWAFADAFARWLLCLAPGGEGGERPCGICKGCRLTAAGNHPDRMQLRLAEGKQRLGIDAIRTIPGFLSLTSQYGGYRVALIDAAERMTTAAANALLKTLEEPPDGACLMLICSRPAQLPITVRSRCQLLRFATPERAAAIRWLRAAAPTVDPDRWPLLLGLAGGAPLQAQALATSELDQRTRALAEQLVALRRGQRGPVSLAQPWSKEPRLLVRVLIHLVEDMLRHYAGKPSMINMMEALCHDFDTSVSVELHRFLARLYRLEGDFDDALNSTLLVEDLLIDWLGAVRGSPPRAH